MGRHRAMTHGQKLRCIGKAVEVLMRSETGRTIHRELGAFLRGSLSNADHIGESAVLTLIMGFLNGYAGSVLEALDTGNQEEKSHVLGDEVRG